VGENWTRSQYIKVAETMMGGPTKKKLVKERCRMRKASMSRGKILKKKN